MAQRLAAAGAVLLTAGCTLVGSATFVATSPAPEPPEDSEELRYAGNVPEAEPASRGGNGPEYSQGGRTYRVLETSRGYREQGEASWYGEPFHGRPTAMGERFDMNRLSAAHRTLPIPCWVRVTNLSNGRSIVLRINDRGPFADPDRRIIDVSYAAAQRLGMVESGTAQVRVEAIEPWQVRPPRRNEEGPLEDGGGVS